MALSGGLLAGVLFVGAHAAGLRLPLLEIDPITPKKKTVEVQTPHWVDHALGTKWGSSASGAEGGSTGSLRQVSPGSAGMVRIDWPDDGGIKSDATGDTLNMLELPSLDMVKGAAGPQSAYQFASRPFRGMGGGMGGGGGFAGGDDGGSMGASHRAQAAQENAVACCDDTTVTQALTVNGLQPLLTTVAFNGPIPEPATWVTVILGLGLTGLMLRTFRRRVA